LPVCTASFRRRFSSAALLALAHDFSPRVEVHAPHVVTLDVSGLSSLLGSPRTIGEELRRSAADRRLFVHVAICASRAAAVVLAGTRAGLTVIDPGGEADALAPLPLRALEAAVAYVCPEESQGTHRGDHVKGRAEPRSLDCLTTFRRWGLKTIGDIAALPADAIFARMGALGGGTAWRPARSASSCRRRPTRSSRRR
jgi:nucleotidyltransferase/DNA polymerase involved in DNA repair